MVSQPHPESALTAAAVLHTLREQPNLFAQFHIKIIALFGSTARNQATPQSNLDFLVEFEEKTTFDRYMDLKFFLEDLFEKKVDLVTKRSLKPQIKQTVLEESIYVL